ncbi:MAG: hypothetical protein QXR97_01995 [Thermoproteota archaeon]
MYGPGAKVIENSIVTEMNSEFGIKAESFIEALKMIKEGQVIKMKRRFEKRKKEFRNLL